MPTNHDTGVHLPTNTYISLRRALQDTQCGHSAYTRPHTHTCAYMHYMDAYRALQPYTTHTSTQGPTGAHTALHEGARATLCALAHLVRRCAQACVKVDPQTTETYIRAHCALCSFVRYMPLPVSSGVREDYTHLHVGYTQVLDTHAPTCR